MNLGFWKRAYHDLETDLKRRMYLTGTRERMSIITSLGSSFDMDAGWIRVVYELVPLFHHKCAERRTCDMVKA